MRCRIFGLFKINDPRGIDFDPSKDLDLTQEPIEELPDGKVDY
jgi:hypothetical protein